jgi:hypothetical protein
MQIRRLAAAVFLLLLACLSPCGWAQGNYASSDLDQLVAPVALYPDPLLSNVMSASTQPQQVKQADQLVRSGQKITQGKTGWDSSVEALTSYPTVLSMMAGNEQWTQALGYAVSNQITDVADAVQRVRYQARQAGNLDSDSKLKVIEEGTNIRIESASPDVIYVPIYDTASIYQPGTVLRYSAAVATNVLLWQSVFNWNDACFYRPPPGWIPPAGYYRPYGWRSAGYYNPAYTYRPYGRAYNNRPVTVNNLNTNINSGRIKLNSNNRTSIGNTNNTGGNRLNTGNFQGRPALPGQRPASVNAGGRFENGSRPGLGSYTSAGSASRDSFRGAQSRGSGSYANGMRSGGRRR